MSDEQADFETLFRDTRAPLLDYLTRRAAAEDAADLLAEVFLIAWRRRMDMPSGDERRLWLFGVARRLLAEHHRFAWKRAHADSGSTDADAPERHDRGHEPRHGRGEAVRRALESLSDLDRELITLTAWENLSSAEAARVVGIAAGTARVRLHRARARLARHPRLQALLEDSDAEAGHATALRPPGQCEPDCDEQPADMSGHVTVGELPSGATPTKPLVARFGDHEVTIEAVGR